MVNEAEHIQKQLQSETKEDYLLASSGSSPYSQHGTVCLQHSIPCLIHSSKSNRIKTRHRQFVSVSMRTSHSSWLSGGTTACNTMGTPGEQSFYHVPPPSWDWALLPSISKTSIPGLACPKRLSWTGTPALPHTSVRHLQPE